MPVVDDLTEAISQFADALVYDALKFTSEALWWLIKAAILLAYQITALDGWLAETVFPPLVQTAAGGTQVAASMTFVMALLLAGLTYLLAIWIRLDVVSPRKAVVWFLAGALFFQVAPQLYQGFHQLRTSLASAFFASGLQGVQSSSGNPFAAFSGVNDAWDPLVPYDLCDNYGPYFTTGGGYHNTIRGTDVALAFLRANGHDVMGYPPPYPSPGGGYCGVPPFTQCELPQWWLENPWVLGGYFYEERASDSFGDYGAQGRRDAIEHAFLGLRRLVASTPLVVMGIVEALTNLLLTLAEGLVFLSVGLALVFSYFRRTEGIALAVLDQMVQLVVQSVVIALMHSLIMGLTFAAAATPNPFLLLGMGTLALILMAILLWSGVRAVFSSVNRLFVAVGQATGGAFITPTQAALGGAGVAAGGALLATGAGLAGAAAASSMLRGGGTDEQPSVASRALRGSTNMFRAGLYSVAAGTGNPRVAQLGHLSMLMHQAAGGGGPRIQRSGPSPTTSPATNDPPPAPARDDALPAPATTASATSPVSGSTTHPAPNGARLPETVAQAGEEVEDALRTQRLTASRDASSGLGQSGAGNEATAPTKTRTQQPVDTGTNRGTPSPAASHPVAVSSVLRNSLRLLQAARPDSNRQQPLPPRAADQAVAQVMGDKRSLTGMGDLTALRTVLQQALRLGLSERQLQGVVRAVQTAPDKQLTPAQQQPLLAYAARRLPPEHAQREVQTLLVATRQLPAQLPVAHHPAPSVTVRPAITVPAPASSNPASTEPDYRAARQRAATLTGSQRLTSDGE